MKHSFLNEKLSLWSFLYLSSKPLLGRENIIKTEKICYEILHKEGLTIYIIKLIFVEFSQFEFKVMRIDIRK